MRPIFIVPVLLLLLAGCESQPRERAAVSATVSVNEAGMASIPVGGSPSLPAEKTALDDAPLPVYSSPRVARVHVAAYINDKGEAFQDTYKYVFVDEGHWNIAALHNPERAYIPAENVLTPQAAPGVIWGAVAPGEAARPTSPECVPARKLFDLDQIRLTGYFERADESKARRDAEKLGKKFGSAVVIFDDDLGWIIVPQSALAPQMAVVRAGPVELPASVPSKPAPSKLSDEDIR
ncbi:MAG: TraV family lipoprotein [Opitutaceae bacterium]